MAKTTADQDFRGITLRMTQLPPRAALKGLARVQRIAAKAGDLFTGRPGLDVLHLAMASATDEDIEWFSAAFSEHTKRIQILRDANGNVAASPELPFRFDEFFAGDLAGSIEFLVWGVKNNFGPFFLGLAASLGLRVERQQPDTSPSDSPKESTGGSGAS